MSLSSSHFRLQIGILFFISTFLLCGYQSARADFELDPSFTPNIEAPGPGPTSIAIQPDGKLLVWKLSSPSLSTPVFKVARLNPDGSLDRFFDTVAAARRDGYIVLQPDGKILVTNASLTGFGSPNQLVRLNADGSLDATLTANWIYSAGQPFISDDGRIVLGVTVFENGVYQNKVVRFNQDGSLDLSVNDSGFWVIGVQHDGRILLGQVNNSSNVIRRLNQDGSDDTAFNSKTPRITTASTLPNAIIEPDGRILLAGIGLNRINSDGTADTTFVPATGLSSYGFQGVVRQPDGKYVGGGYAFYYSSNPIIRKRIFRVNYDGSLDATFDAHTNEEYGSDSLVPLAIRADGTILARGNLRQASVSREGIVSLLPNGAIDPTFNAAPWDRTDAGVTLMLEQPDGKLLIAGPFTSVNGADRNGIARLNPDGSTDAGFLPSPLISGRFDTLVTQPDGKVLIGGYFTINDQGPYCLIRLNGDGSLDGDFTAGTMDPILPSQVTIGASGVAVLGDGRIVVGGFFSNYGGSGRNNLVRLTSNGVVDISYSATSTYATTFIPLNGKIYFSGTVAQDGSTCSNCRLNGDGTLDLSFHSSSNVLAAQADGKLLTIRGVFNGEESVPYIYRLLTDGTVDTSFTPTRCLDTRQLLVQSDGRIMQVGFSSYVNAYILRVKANGGFDAGVKIVNPYAMKGGLISRSGKLIVYGKSITWPNQSPRAMLRLNISYPHAYFDYDGDGKTDESVFRPSESIWYLNRSQAGFVGYQFGADGDVIAPADFTGDGKTDVAVFRPSVGTWFILKSEDNTFYSAEFGAAGDIPAPGDFDGDGKADTAVFRPLSGYWFMQKSTAGFAAVPFGTNEDVPTLGDFDGDGKTDVAVFRPSEGVWYRLNSSNGSFFGAQFGRAGDKVVPADYSGDGKTDLAVWRPSEGVWYIMRSEDNSFYGQQFGTDGDMPAPGDFDGDGKADVAVFRPGTGIWYEQRSTSGFNAVPFGTVNDKPTTNAYVY